MVVRDTGNLQLPVSLTEIRAPLAVAAARLRAQPLRPALLVGGVALAFALLLSVLGGTLAARQQSLHRLLPAADKPPERVVFAIGPEGGFDPAEADRARELGFICAGLGPRILRSETASLAALSILGFVFGDVGS